MKRLAIIVVMVLAWVSIQADVVTLKNGAQVRGTIVLQNDEVVILRNASGVRMQYPRAEVVSITQNEEQEQQQAEVQTVGEGHKKKASILLEVGMGFSILPNDHMGGIHYNADLLVGTHNLADRKIFVGGGLGYHGEVIDRTYHFLPIQAALRAPLMLTKHAPTVGVSLGYGVALDKNYTGGMYADLMLGYRYEINSKSSLALSADVQFQQATIQVVEEMGGDPNVNPDAGFINKAGRSIVRTGLKLSLFF